MMSRPHPLRAWRGWTRRRRIVVAAISAFVLVGGVAAAVVFFTAKINGSAEIQAVRVVWDTPAVTQSSNGLITCTPTVNPDGSLTVNISGAFAGASCVVESNVQAVGSDINLVVQGLRYNDQVGAAFLPGQGCGLAISTTTKRQVQFRLSIPMDAVAGNFPASSDAGLKAVRSSEYVPANCPEVTP